ncbi:glucosaminidase domain-containing protein [Pallidibacillus pasinlerensis]|uniref:Mannosyl-glycoprotein endo-beta-N-acetylglucosamidase-like domain-containing protein n=1 Tax=Pallidibacillus pasinlerensis TaxID=2703818 RepID=A0ABX0A589_9BACI|nr:glucosaminidase domain-containing protein [Pallidibacillus pasinlerensis]NCU17679.1 hypothetical protein [Pallidibacillus pasinlerensis]
MLRKLSILILTVLFLSTSLLTDVSIGYAKENNVEAGLENVVEQNSIEPLTEEEKPVDENEALIQSQLSTDEDNEQVVTSEEENETENVEVQNDEFTNVEEIENSEVTEEAAVQTFSLMSAQVAPSVSYRTHVQSYGWLDYVADGKMSGTEGEAKRLEAIKIKLDNAPYSGGIEYRTHVQSYGWLGWQSNDKLSGTEGEAKRLEAIEIRLTGDMAKHYDVYYRVHAQSYGWLDWAKNGQPAGTAGLAKRLEAIQIVLVEKGGQAPGSTNKPYVTNVSVKYSTHVQSYGWLDYVADGKMSGTEGEAKRLEAIKIKLDNAPYSGGIEYRTHVQSYGWLGWQSNDKLSGTEGEAKRLEAIQIRLTGDMAKHYDVYYRVHAQSYGWLDWAKNGQPAGTAGLAKRLEAIQIVLVEKGGQAPGSTNKPYVTNVSVKYSTHVQSYGWLDYVADGKMSGTEGEAKRLEAIKIKVDNAPYSGGIEYRTHVQSYGWLGWQSNDKLSGTEGEAKRLEAIQIRLTGDMAKHYDVYYRVHAQSYGWLGWAKNGESAGTEGLSKRLEAIEIVLVEKGGKAPGSTKDAYLSEPSVVYSTHVQGYGWLTTVNNGKISGKPGEGKRVEALKISLENSPYEGSITYTTHVQKDGWLNPVQNGAISGTTGEGKRVEAVQINLTGDIAKHYDIYYRTYVSDYGWLGWAKNGMNAGSEGLAKPLEAIEVKLVPKGKGSPVNESAAYYKGGLFISYSNFNFTLDEAVNMQMKVSPQTDKKLDAYVDAGQVNLYGSIAGYGVNLRTEPKLDNPDNIAAYLEHGTEFIVLDRNVTGDAFQGSTTWFKVMYADQILYVHSKLAKIDYGVTTTAVKVYEAPNTNSFNYASLNPATILTILELGEEWHKVQYPNSWRHAKPEEVAQYLNPEKFAYDEKQRLQFLDLSKQVNVSVEVLNKYLEGKGVLEGKGEVFLEASKYGKGMNVVYLVAHSLLETGNGTSALANGIEYADTGVTVYNMYGIGARDSNPNGLGAQRAYEKGWFSVEEAIVGGAKWIYDNYINAGQNSLYKMRWNPEAMQKLNRASHQYATDIGWAYKQINRLYGIMNEIYQSSPYEIHLEIPIYKK